MCHLPSSHSFSIPQLPLSLVASPTYSHRICRWPCKTLSLAMLSYSSTVLRIWLIIPPRIRDPVQFDVSSIQISRYYRPLLNPSFYVHHRLLHYFPTSLWSYIYIYTPSRQVLLLSLTYCLYQFVLAVRCYLQVFQKLNFSPWFRYYGWCPVQSSM